MSAKTDDALQSIQNIIAKGMPHKDDMYAVQGYCDMLAGAIAAIKAERDAWKATAGRMAEWMTEACQHCPLGYTKTRCQANDYSECKGIILAHFGAPEDA